jgi:phosphatidylinositol alpha 1,6-mannosyltransferase
MPRGVDAELFHPGKRKRDPEDRDQVLGFVGRLVVEKNVRCWPRCRKSWSGWGTRTSGF